MSQGIIKSNAVAEDPGAKSSVAACRVAGSEHSCMDKNNGTNGESVHPLLRLNHSCTLSGLSCAWRREVPQPTQGTVTRIVICRKCYHEHSGVQGVK